MSEPSRTPRSVRSNSLTTIIASSLSVGLIWWFNARLSPVSEKMFWASLTFSIGLVVVMGTAAFLCYWLKLRPLKSDDGRWQITPPGEYHGFHFATCLLTSLAPSFFGTFSGISLARHLGPVLALIVLWGFLWPEAKRYCQLLANGAELRNGPPKKELKKNTFVAGKSVFEWEESIKKAGVPCAALLFLVAGFTPLLVSNKTATAPVWFEVSSLVLALVAVISGGRLARSLKDSAWLEQPQGLIPRFASFEILAMAAVAADRVGGKVWQIQNLSFSLLKGVALLVAAGLVTLETRAYCRRLLAHGLENPEEPPG